MDGFVKNLQFFCLVGLCFLWGPLAEADCPVPSQGATQAQYQSYAQCVQREFQQQQREIQAQQNSPEHQQALRGAEQFKNDPGVIETQRQIRAQAQATENDPELRICRAAQDGNLAEVRRWRARLGERIRSDKPRCSYVADAAVNGHLEVVRYLLSEGAKMDVLTGLGQRVSPLTLTAASPDSRGAMIRFLISKGAAVNGQDENQMMSGMRANEARQGRESNRVRAGSCNVQLNQLRESTALFEAVARGHVDNVRALLDARANPNVYSHGMTPLMSAAENGDAAKVRMLLAAGADRSLKNATCEKTALQYAEASGRTEVAALLRAQ